MQKPRYCLNEKYKRLIGIIEVGIAERANFFVFLATARANHCSAIRAGQRITLVNRHSAIGAIFHRANLRFYYSLRYSSIFIRDNRFFSPFFAFKTINSFKSHFFACFSGQNVVKYKGIKNIFLRV